MMIINTLALKGTVSTVEIKTNPTKQDTLIWNETVVITALDTPYNLPYSQAG